MSYERFISEQLDLTNIAKAYKNNSKFRDSVDQDPSSIFQDGLKGYEGAVEICRCSDTDYYFVLPADPNVIVDDALVNELSAAKWSYIGQDNDSFYYQDLENEQRYRYAKDQPYNPVDGLTTFVQIDAQGNDIPNSAFRAKGPM